MGEARYCLKLNDDLFDWMTVDANRNMKMITTYDWNHGTQMNMKEARRMNTGLYKGQVEHKYDYSANQFDVRAWGWSSSDKHVGVWLVNPSVEYLSGGPTKFELSSHRDATFNTNAAQRARAADPVELLARQPLRRQHLQHRRDRRVDEGRRAVPDLLQFRRGPRRAVARRAGAEPKRIRAWPYDWVNGVDYPHKDERATVSGKIVLNDPQAPGLKIATCSSASPRRIMPRR